MRQDLWLDFSVGTISAAHGMVTAVLDPVCEVIKQAIQSKTVKTVKHVDEASHQSHGHLTSLRALACNWGATFQIQASRGELALGKDFKGTRISDRYSGYNGVDVQQRQLCRSHLLCDFQRIGGEMAYLVC
ncbi:IS66 family transposase [Chromobacterium violaceum]|uniref:IS66 family transposase n=1 Tax=Chromobacterium violaceum TaxID=536 RepID=UPI00384EF0A7